MQIFRPEADGCADETRGRREPAPGATFTGEVHLSPVHRDEHSAITVVTFHAGARTWWHSHEHGQLLLVTAGEGWVESEDGGVPVEAGDLVWAEPGERHWHGARPGSQLTHVAVSVGRTTWLGEAARQESG